MLLKLRIVVIVLAINYLHGYGQETNQVLLLRDDEDPTAYSAHIDNHHRSRRTTKELYGRGFGKANNKVLTKGVQGNRLLKCTFVGNVGIKNNCVEYLMCPLVKAHASKKFCPGSKHFDYIQRKCIKQELAQCDYKTICPNSTVEYQDPFHEDWLLKCSNKYSVPFPVKKKRNETKVEEKVEEKAEELEE